MPGQKLLLIVSKGYNGWVGFLLTLIFRDFFDWPVTQTKPQKKPLPPVAAAENLSAMVANVEGQGRYLDLRCQLSEESDNQFNKAS